MNASGTISVGEFLPPGYVTDGSISYQTEIQAAIDAAARTGGTLYFPGIVYRLDERGLEVRSGLTLSMYGAAFRLSEACRSDGQAFLGRGVSDVEFLGGEIAGHVGGWPAGVNVRGIYMTGPSERIRVRDMHIHDLSSNGLGVFGDADRPARDVWATDLVIEHCSNFYGDYLSERPGPEPGSVREDQGLIACYYVEDFVVRGCRLERSRSDATHFYRCRQGQFVHNRVRGAQMGGYFLETCADVVASDNLICDNGSRGVTIERGSSRCTLANSVIAGSGRDGLWAPNCSGLVITGNVFDRNGRKPNGGPGQIWNANITVDAAAHDPTRSTTQDYVIEGNILYTTGSQVAAMRIDAGVVSGIVVRGNLLRGENRRIWLQRERRGRVLVEGNA